MSKRKDLTRSEALKLLWKKRVLKWQLHDVQKIMYNSIVNANDETGKIEGSDEEMHVLLCSRRLGKSFLLCLISAEQCLQNKNSIVKYICPKQKMVKTIIKPIMRTIFENAPEGMKPEFKTNDNLFEFPNGSQIQLAGTDNGNHENLRGGYSNIWIVDEAGFCDELDYVVNSVLSPTTDTTDGFGILASTPSKEPDHPFISEFVERFDMEGRLLKYTIDDNPMMTPEKIKKIEDRYVGGRTNPEFRREYLCEIIRDEEDVVIPEFNAAAEKDIVKEDKRPNFFDSYVGMDIGGKDFTVALFGYYDYLNNFVVIEDELVLKNRQNSQAIAEGLKSKIELNWGEKPPYLMFADNNNQILLNDLQMYHGLNFITTRKDNKEAAINRVRLMINNRELVINPRCTTLIAHLKACTWVKSKTAVGYKKFARAADGSHYDAVDALIYLLRNVVYGKNPYPKGYNDLASADSFSRKVEHTGYERLARMFKGKN